MIIILESQNQISELTKCLQQEQAEKSSLEYQTEVFRKEIEQLKERLAKLEDETKKKDEELKKKDAEVQSNWQGQYYYTVTMV